jgi:hypothetical protein
MVGLTEWRLTMRAYVKAGVLIATLLGTYLALLPLVA